VEQVAYKQEIAWTYAICYTQVSRGCIIKPNAESIKSDYFAKNDRIYNRLWEGTKSIIIPIPKFVQSIVLVNPTLKTHISVKIMATLYCVA